MSSSKHPTIGQGVLFAQENTLSKDDRALPQSGYKPPPDLTLTGGLLRETLQSDGVYLLRILSNRYAKADDRKSFLHTLKAEIRLKQGKTEATCLLRDCLLRRNLKKFLD